MKRDQEFRRNGKCIQKWEHNFFNIKTKMNSQPTPENLKLEVKSVETLRITQVSFTGRRLSVLLLMKILGEKTMKEKCKIVRILVNIEENSQQYTT